MFLTLERLVLAALALVGVGAVFIARGYSDGTAHGGELMPTIAGGLTASLALIALLRTDAAQEAEANGISRRVWAVLVGTALFLTLMPVIGYPLVAPHWVGGTMIILGARHHLTIAGTAVILPAIAYSLLAGLAYAPPPLGIFGGN